MIPMKLIVRVILLVIMNQLNAQSEYWIKTYIIKFNNRKDTNYFPTYLEHLKLKMIQYFQYLNQPTQQYKIITGQALEY